MSLSRRGIATPEPTLTSLPHDIHLHLLHFMHPTQIALYSQLCTLTHTATVDPSLWANIARRHLAISPPAGTTPASVSALAQSLVSKWWLVTGAIVPGIPVHFRKGFAEIHSRGGHEIILDDSGNSAYVWGGKQKEHPVPTAMPGMELDLYLDAAGPFPVEGIKVRVLHAARDEQVDDGMDNLHPSLELRKNVVAKARIRMNEEDDREVYLHPSGRFEALEFVVGADALRTKPRMNRLFIEYDKHSTASYWIKEVLIMPCVLPMPKLEESKLMFEGGLELGKTSETEMENQNRANGGRDEEREVRTTGDRRGNTQTNSSVNIRLSSRPRNEERSPRLGRDMARSQSRRGANLGELDMAKLFLSETVMGKGKMQKSKRVMKTPKHMYHHNHYRSPRGNSRGGPASPKAKGR